MPLFLRLFYRHVSQKLSSDTKLISLPKRNKIPRFVTVICNPYKNRETNLEKSELIFFFFFLQT